MTDRRNRPDRITSP